MHSDDSLNGSLNGTLDGSLNGRLNGSLDGRLNERVLIAGHSDWRFNVAGICVASMTSNGANITIGFSALPLV